MKVMYQEPLARHGYWRVGGPMDRFVIVEEEQELPALLQDAPVYVLGNGSNLLAPDEGLRGTTLRLGLREVEVIADDGVEVLLRVGAGLLNTVLLRRVAALELAGLGPLAGVPGTVGGAVVMNAGTALGEVETVIHSVRVVGPAGAMDLPRAALPMRYRDGGLPPDVVVTSVVFRLRRAGFAEEQAHIAAHLARRKATQPLDLPSCGSVFRNPPGDHAGRLIEAVGLKGHAIGGARISEKHANFIVNNGSATAAEVMACIRLAYETVLAQTGVTLEPEVRVLGAWPREVWPLNNAHD